MSADEAAIMEQHVSYWQQLAERGTPVVFGPVSDPAGVWGLAVVEADSVEDVTALRLAAEQGFQQRGDLELNFGTYIGTVVADPGTLPSR